MPIERRWIWPFKLDEKIGEGGMGVVYRGRYVKNDRLVAVKLLPPDVAADPTMLARFEREVAVLKELKHPHIVHCFGGVCEDDQRFYAMELVDGGSVESLLRERSRLQWEQVVEYGLQLCSALAFAHQHGFVHRDIKPANLLLTRTGKLKLSDFGLAHVRTAGKLTAVDRTVGTYYYMAPEQIRGRPPVSPQTDLYAMGCVMFEMLTGRPPFTGETPAEVLHHHLKQTPPRVSAEAPDCPAQLESLISELLSKKPEHRPANATAVAARLQQITQTVPVSLGASGRGVRNRPLAAQTVVLSDSEVSSLRWDIKPRRLLAAASVVLVGLVVWTIAVHVGWLRYKSSAGQATGLWIQAYHSESVPVRLAAVKALGELSSAAETSVPVLTAGLSDENPSIRAATAESLGKLGVQAQPAMAALLRSQQTDPDPRVRTQASQAMKAIRTADHPGPLWPYFAVIILAALVAVVVILAKRSALHRRSVDDAVASPRKPRLDDDLHSRTQLV